MSLRVSVNTSSTTGLGRLNFRAVAERWADQADPIVRDAIRDRTPVAQAPGGGRLRDSVRYSRYAIGTAVVAQFTTSVPYARYVIDGTPPHIIRPRAARMLRWLNGGGDPVYARQVHHPGTSANDYPRRAVQPLLPMLQAKFAEIAEQSVKEGTP